MILLQIENITKRFASAEAVTTAVDNISLEIAEGEIVCLLGPSGCGKTTLLRLIAGLETADSGQLLFAGQAINHVPPHQRDFGLMFQDYALFPHKNVADNVAFGLKMHGRDARETAERVREVLELVQLAGYGQRTIEQLSGGERQRVALARALAVNPRLLMLDEPLGALDRALRERLMIDLRQILKRVGVTAVYVTHDQTEAYAIADQIVVMNKGHIEQKGTPEAVYDQPRTPFVARFLGFENVLAGTVRASGVVDTAVGQFQLSQPAEAGQPITLLLRPRAATLAQTPDTPDLNHLQGTLQAVSFRGRYYQVWLVVNGHKLVFDMPAPPAASPGETVALAIAPEKVRVMG